MVFRGSKVIETYFYSDTLRKGTITFTKFSDSIVAGTFRSQAFGRDGADSGKVVTVNEGRFDLKKK